MPDTAFPRELRLLSTKDFDFVFKDPVRASAKGILVLAVPNEGHRHPRLGLIVPKKALKRAVWRNRIKRVIRESFRLNQHTLPDVDIVVLAKPAIREYTNQELCRTLLKLWDQISHRLAR